MAAETSTIQMALTRDVAPGGFMERLNVMLPFIANSVLSEVASTPHHTLRAGYAQRIINAPQPAAVQAAPCIVMGVNIVNTTVYDDATKTATCTIADIDLQSQIQTMWNSLAGIDQAT